MFAGHIGAGLLVKRFEPRLNLGVVLCGALFADLLLWLLVICGVESVGAPRVAGGARFLTFAFPYSHGLAASALWATLAAAVGWRVARAHAAYRARVAWALALAVLSHFVLDLVVHVPELPVLSAGSPRLGLGLWRNMPAAVALELALAALALGVYLRSARCSTAGQLLVGGTVVATAVLTAVGPYTPGDPPPAAGLALSSLVVLTVVVLLGFAADGRRTALVD